MKVLVISPGQSPVPQEIDGTAESMREIVGGGLQAMYPSDDIALVFNKDGYVQHLPPNRGILDAEGAFMEIIHGTFFLCGAPEDSNYFVSLTTEQVQHYMKVYASPEVFLNLGGRTIILPCGEDHPVANENLLGHGWPNRLPDG